MNVVISQPMFFPWIGMFEQIRLADIYVHYSDVQYSKGSFVNRVQIKTDSGVRWLTVPLEKLKLGQRIDEVHINYQSDWKQKHLMLLEQAYAESPYFSEMLDLVSSVYAGHHETIDQLSKASISAICTYFGIDRNRRFIDVSELAVEGSGSQRVLDIVLALKGDRYITGLGALKYLDHQIFEDHNIKVEYMNYRKAPYSQLHGEFTPYVSVLDLIANEGKAGSKFIFSETIDWKEMKHHG